MCWMTASTPKNSRYPTVSTSEKSTRMKPQLPWEIPRSRRSLSPRMSRTVLTVSRLMDRKGIDRVIEAMPAIVRNVPGTRYVVVGDGGDRERVHDLASKSPVRSSITFLGPLTGDKKFECYSRCDVFALPAREDGFPVVIPEANAFGKPVVGGRSGGIPEAITHGENGLLVDPNSVDDDSAITGLLARIPQRHIGSAPTAGAGSRTSLRGRLAPPLPPLSLRDVGASTNI